MPLVRAHVIPAAPTHTLPEEIGIPSDSKHLSSVTSSLNLDLTPSIHKQIPVQSQIPPLASIPADTMTYSFNSPLGSLLLLVLY